MAAIAHPMTPCPTHCRAVRREQPTTPSANAIPVETRSASVVTAMVGMTA